MRRHLIGDEHFYHIVRRIKNLRYVRAANCFFQVYGIWPGAG